MNALQSNLIISFPSREGLGYFNLNGWAIDGIGLLNGGRNIEQASY
ncbi:MAG: hypothetical protein M1480_21615 [Bacteroidetes bacterium]|nr:hypothetical protein [Bacteroidota bacterium]